MAAGEAPVRHQAARRKPGPARRANAIRVLLVEDVAADAELAVRELRRGGLKVDHRVVKSEAGFRAALAEFLPDVILSDFSMPGFDGMLALRLAHELAPDTPFIFVSGTLGEEYAIRALRQGATDYVLKTNLVRLPAAVERAVQEARERAAKREAERALHESEAGLRRAQSMAGLAHIVTRPDGTVESWSETLPGLLGVAPDAIPPTALGMLELVHPEDRERCRQVAIEAARRGTRMELDYRLQHAEKGIVHFCHVMEPLGAADAQGRMRWFNTLQDVTAQRQAARALQSSVELYRSTFEQAAVGIVHSALEGELLMVNQAYAAMTGYTRAEAIQLHIRDLTHPEDFARSAEVRASITSGADEPYQRELRLVRKDKSQLWASVTTALVRDVAGKPLHFVSVIQDISERRRAEEEIERFRSAMDVTIDSIYLADPETMRFLYVNDTACRRLGYAREALLQKTSYEVVGKTWEQVKREYDDVIAAGDEGTRTESEFVRSDGSRGWTELHRRALRTGDKWIIVTLGRDITDRKRAEMSVRESEARFRSLTELSADWYWEQDAEFRFTSFAGGEDTWKRGADQGSLIGRRRWELEGVIPLSMSWDEHRATLKARQPYRDFEYQRMGSDGKPRYVSASGEPVFDSEGHFTGYRGTARDITDKVAAQHALREAEQRYRSIFEGSAEGLNRVSPQGALVAANPAMARMFGYESPEEIVACVTDVGKLYVDVVDRQRILDGLNSAGVVRGFETRMLRKDGSVIWVSMSVRLVKDADGAPLHVEGAIQDITERKLQQDRIEGLSRTYAVLSGINSMIVRVGDREALLRDACRIALEQGGFPIAWAGIVDRETMEVRPVAWQGVDEDYVRTLRRAVGKVAPGKGGIVGIAVRGREPVVSNDIARDARLTHGASAVERGSRALVVLPLLVGGEAAGVLALHAREVGFFDEQEMRLMRELAGDVSFALEHIAKTEKLNYLALYDPLTGLANRTLLAERLGQSIQGAGQSGAKFAVVWLDLERLTTINDSLGRQVGDGVIREVAERLRRHAGPNAAARITADHFVAVLPPVKGRSEAGRIAANLAHACFAEPYRVEGHELKLAAKAGLALFPNDGVDAETLLANAEAALRKAKQAGERQLFYTPDLTERTGATLTLENKLRRALDRDEFVLHYQPKFDTETRRLAGVEALIRWQSPELGLVPPMKFIPLMEETGMILDVGAWALRRASLDHRKWTEAGLKPPRVAVNVSAIQLRQRDFVAAVEQAILEGLAPTGIDLEITESLIMRDIEANIEKLKAARALGVGVAIDDFGTGYSSLSYLAKLPVQTLKIDRSFIIAMLKEPDTMTLVQTIISLAHAMRLKVVAEGVDAEEQARVLRLLRCDQLQGYLLSKPLPHAEMTALLERKPQAQAGSR